MMIIKSIPPDMKLVLQSDSEFTQARNKQDFLEVVKIVKKHVVGKSGPRRAQESLNALHAINMETSLSFGDYVKRATKLYRQWEAMRSGPAERATLEAVARSFTENLSSPFEQFKYIQLRELEQPKSSAITLSDVMKNAREFASTMKIKVSEPKEPGTEEHTVMIAQTSATRGGCYRCGIRGHNMRDCKEVRVCCDICRRERKPVYIAYGHSTKAHRTTGGRQPQEKQQEQERDEVYNIAVQEDTVDHDDDDEGHFVFHADADVGVIFTDKDANHMTDQVDRGGVLDGSPGTYHGNQVGVKEAWKERQDVRPTSVRM